jgi:sugar phosphate isomerase/epimerase
MKLSSSTIFCLDKQLEDAIPELLKLTVKRIEIADSGYHALNNSRVRKLKRLKETYGLNYSIHAPYSDTNLSADDDKIRKTIVARIKRSIVYAKELRAQALIFHPGWRTSVHRFDKDRTWRLNFNSVCEILEFAKNQKVTALIENMPDTNSYMMKSIKEFHTFLEEIGLETKIVLDVAHANIGGEIENFLLTLSDNIKHVHLSDNNGIQDRHLSIGKGDINWNFVIDSLKRIGFDGWIVIESYNGIQASLEYIKNLIN